MSPRAGARRRCTAIITLATAAQAHQSEANPLALSSASRAITGRLINPKTTMSRWLDISNAPHVATT